MDNRFDSLNTSLQQRPQLLGNHAARLEQFGMRFDDLNRVRVLGNLMFLKILILFKEKQIYVRQTRLLIYFIFFLMFQMKKLPDRQLTSEIIVEHSSNPCPILQTSLRDSLKFLMQQQKKSKNRKFKPLELKIFCKHMQSNEKQNCLN